MAGVTALPYARPLTRTDLQTLPDDGHRYELIDGTLVVSPAPRHLHQRAVLRLSVLLDAACPAAMEVLCAPFAVELAEDTELQPDLLVAPRGQFTDRELVGGGRPSLCRADPPRRSDLLTGLRLRG